MVDFILPPDDRFITASAIPGAIAQERTDLNLRPTAVVLARSKSSGLYLFVEQMREESAGILWPIQGGINNGEQPHVGAAREANEETGLRLCPDRLTLLAGMRYENGRLRDGFLLGKLFVGFCLEYDESNSGCNNINPNPDEIRSIKYASKEEILNEILPNNVLERPKTKPKAEFIEYLLSATFV